MHPLLACSSNTESKYIGFVGGAPSPGLREERWMFPLTPSLQRLRTLEPLHFFIRASFATVREPDAIDCAALDPLPALWAL